MPNRIIKESICTSDSVDQLDWFEEVLFYRLIVNCDDYGRYDGRPAIIKNRLFPLKDSLTLEDVKAAMRSLVKANLIVLYENDGRPYLYLPTWNNHQSIRAKKSKYPAPEDSVISSESICNQLYADVPVIQSNPILIQSESNTNRGKNKFSTPTLEEVRDYCLERRNNVDPQRFMDYYTSNGWRVGKNPMRDWKAAVRNWERGDKTSDNIFFEIAREEGLM